MGHSSQDELIAPPETASAPEHADVSGGKRRFAGWLKQLPKKLALVAVAVLVTLVALEGVFRLFGYQAIYGTYSKPDLFWRHDAELGWSLQPRSHGEYVGPAPYPVEFRGKIRVNSLGLRGGEVKALPPGGQRVLVLGDSVAAGFEVDENKTYAAELQGNLTKRLGTPVQVVNGAVRGYGTDQEYLEYRDRTRSLHPNLVVLHLTANDPEDNTTLHRMRRPFGKPVFELHPDGSLHLTGAPVPRYPLCSASRIDAAFHVRRIDSVTDRTFCWVETHLTDRSALFSFMVQRIQSNPGLVKFFHGLGTPRDQEAPIPPPRSSRAAKKAPPSSPATTRAPAPSTAAPVTTPAPTSPPTPASGSVPTPFGPVRGSDYSRTLTSVLVLTLASAVHQDGGQFVLVAQSADLNGLDVGAFTRNGINVQTVDGALGSNFSATHYANDGHLNARGHRKIAGALTQPIAELLKQQQEQRQQR